MQHSAESLLVIEYLCEYESIFEPAFLHESGEIERYKREREEEMRKQQGGMTRAPSMILHHWWLGGAVSRLMSPQG
jgi:hypothetical protein